MRFRFRAIATRRPLDADALAYVGSLLATGAYTPPEDHAALGGGDAMRTDGSPTAVSVRRVPVSGMAGNAGRARTRSGSRCSGSPRRERGHRRSRERQVPKGTTATVNGTHRERRAAWAKEPVDLDSKRIYAGDCRA